MHFVKGEKCKKCDTDGGTGPIVREEMAIKKLLVSQSDLGKECRSCRCQKGRRWKHLSESFHSPHRTSIKRFSFHSTTGEILTDPAQSFEFNLTKAAARLQ